MTAQPNIKKGTTMAEKQELSVREKKELVAKEEKTIPGRYYVPYADIHETDDALAVVLEMPGVEKKDLNIALENDVLRVDGQIDFTKYKDMEPVYTEYNVGHYARSFTLSNKVDQEKITANLEDGVLTLTLPKAKHAQPRKIAIGVKTVISPARWAEGYGIGALSLAPKRSEGWPVASTRHRDRSGRETGLNSDRRHP